MYQGAADGSTTTGWTTLDPSSLEATTGETVINTIGHSTMGGLVVGNYDTYKVVGKAFIYDINTKTYQALKVDKVSITAYGIWYNQGTSYTITGGYSDVVQNGINTGYVIDYDSKTHQISNLLTLSYENMSPSVVGTHIQGITSDDVGGYNLVADWNYPLNQTTAAYVHLPRNSDGSYGTPRLGQTTTIPVHLGHQLIQCIKIMHSAFIKLEIMTLAT